MSKELTPLEALRIVREHDFPLMITTNPPIPSTMNGKTEKELWNIIEKALKEKENIEKTINELFSDNGKVITTIDIKKQLKALEIIKKKNVDVLRIKITQNVEQYNNRKIKGCRNLTQEEYELLKEVLL